MSLSKDNRDLVTAAQAQGLSTPKERTGMHTTAVAVQVGEPTAILADSGRRHAGETLQEGLAKREAGLEKPLAMSDALARHEVADEARLMRCHCLAHGRRTCSDVEEGCPHACQVVRAGSRQVCDHDEPAREAQLSPAVRLAYPQAQSQPLMDERTGGRDTQREDQLVEPNSAWGKAIGSRRRHGKPWTRLLSVTGAPIDNTLAERVLKLCIRQRTNALLSTSPHSAYSASVLTSLMATCISGGVNAVESLVARHEHRHEVFANPAAWLPWASASRQASLEATRRQSWAIWARSGWPFPVNMMRSRADRGTRASALVGHHAKRPCESLLSIIP